MSLNVSSPVSKKSRSYFKLFSLVAHIDGRESRNFCNVSPHFHRSDYSDGCSQKIRRCSADDDSQARMKKPCNEMLFTAAAWEYVMPLNHDKLGSILNIVSAD